MTERHIGDDQWVAQYPDRTADTHWLAQQIRHIASQLPLFAWIVIALVVVAGLPILSGQSYLLRVMGSLSLMVMLGAGLTIVMGYSGLLDLGYMAFYGMGAYGFAYLSSDFTAVHLPIFLSLPLILLVCSTIGALLGTISLRLSGDYLAIATLGFGLIFVQLMSKLTRVHVPGQPEPIDLTGGANGIVHLDGLNLGWTQIDNLHGMYAVMVVAAALVLLIVYRLHHSPIGRGWEALREDELAATTMGIPAKRLKVLAFTIGAGIAGFAGAFFGLWQGSVFPSSFELTSLIILYSVVVLGGLGSVRGVIVGSVFMVALPEILRQPALANGLFYLASISLILMVLKARWITLISLILLTISGWYASQIPLTSTTLNWGNGAFLGLIVLLLLLAQVKSSGWRFGLLCLLLPMMTVAWHWRLLPEPGITRFIVLGALLIAVMIYRPNGLFGQKRVEVL